MSEEDKRLKRIAKRIMDELLVLAGWGGPGSKEHEQEELMKIIKALRKERKRAFEEAAEIADSVPEGCCEEYSDCPIAIAEAIRKKAEELG